MIFCGQCGLQLAPENLRCPRCGTIVEEEKLAEDVLHTRTSPSQVNPSQIGPVMSGSPPQQQLVLRPGTTANSYSPQDATSMIEAASYNSNMPPRQNMGTPYPGSGPYHTQTSYPNYSMPGGTYAPTGMPSPAMASQIGYAAPHALTTGNPTLRVTGLVIALFGVLLILSAVVLFAMQHNGVIS